MEAICATNSPVLPVLPCPVCGVIDTPVLGPGRGPHVGALQCQAGHFIKWAPKALICGREVAHTMDSLNILIVSGVLDRMPSVRFREEGTCLCTGTLRLEELGTSGTVFKTYLPFEAYGKVGEQVGEWQAGDVCTLQGKVFWRKYHTKSGDDKSGLALLAQKGSVLVPAAIEATR